MCRTTAAGVRAAFNTLYDKLIDIAAEYPDGTGNRIDNVDMIYTDDDHTAVGDTMAFMTLDRANKEQFISTAINQLTVFNREPSLDFLHALPVNGSMMTCHPTRRVEMARVRESRSHLTFTANTNPFLHVGGTAPYGHTDEKSAHVRKQVAAITQFIQDINISQESTNYSTAYNTLIVCTPVIICNISLTLKYILFVSLVYNMLSLYTGKYLCVRGASMQGSR